MRKIAFAMVLVFLAALTMPMAGEAKGKNHDLTATIVSIDLKAKTITVKGDDGQEHTAQVQGGAVEELGKIKAGDKVTLTCHDNEKGEHEAVTAIKPVKS
jgi:translation initiation factor IF-1